MAVLEFPAADFVVAGDPVAIRESGRGYARFATVTGSAADAVRSLDAGSWIGSEGDEYRSKLRAIPPPLDVAHGAFGEVASALSVFADAVAAAQQRMAGIRDDAEGVHARLVSASSAREGLTPPDGPAQEADPSAAGRYEAARSTADARVTGLQSQWRDELTRASSLRAQVHESAAQAAARVRAAARRSPTAGQNWLHDRWEKAGHWVDDRGAALRDWLGRHAGVLRRIAAVARVVGIALVVAGAVLSALSFVAGFLSAGIGWLGEVPAGTLIALGLALWGGADVVDAAADWGDGTTDGTGLLVDLAWAAGTAVAAGTLVRLAGKLAERFSRVARAEERHERPGAAPDVTGSARLSTRTQLPRSMPRPTGSRPRLTPPWAGPRARAHVFEGEGKKKLTGYHARPGGFDRGRAHVVADTVIVARNGCYEARWTWTDEAGQAVLNGDGTTKRKWSTFFPDRWSDADVETAIAEAFDHASARGLPAGDHRFQGTVDGVTIEGWFDPVTHEITTAYPKWPQP